MSGLWCAGLGFGDEEMIEAATEQLRTLPYYHLFGAKGTEPAIELAEKLKEIAPVPISKVFFTSSGSEANDTQVKLAWYMNNALGRPNKKKIISRIKAYHGVTIMAASLTGLPYNHIGWDLPVDRVLHTDCPHYYRFGKDGESEAEFVARMVQSLRDLIEREGPDTIAALIAEPVMGAGGVIVPPKGYYRGDPGGARRARHHHDRRRGHHRLRPHRQLVGLPDARHDADDHLGRQAAHRGLCAARRRDGAGGHLPGLCRPFGRRSARFGHGFTYGGHPLGCALGVKAIEIYQKRNIVGHVRRLTPVFAARHEEDRRAPAGRRDALLRAGRRRRTRRRQEDQAVLRSEEGRRRRNSPNSSKAMARSCARSATASRSARR